ncbi:MAG: glycosyltransferase family 4 protein [Acidobacteriota bacterium]
MNPTLPTSEPELRVALIDDVREVPADQAWAAEMARHRVEKLAIGFARQGLTVDIYRARSPGEPVWEDLYAGVRIHRVTDRMPWPADDQSALSQSVMSFVERIKCLASSIYPCDAVHAWGPYAGLVGLRLTRLLRDAPFVLNMQGAGPVVTTAAEGPAQQRNLAAIESLLAHRADYLVAASEAEQDALLNEHGPQTAETLHMVPMGVDCQTFRPGQKRQARKELGLPQEGFIVLWGDLLQPGGTMNDATSMLKKLPEGSTHMLFIGAGMGSAQPAFSADRGRTVIDLGHPGTDCIRTLRTAYAAADVMVVPPTAQAGCGLSPREAMSCGTPVIAMGCCQNDELASVIIDGVTGYVLYRPDAAPVVQLLRELQEQPQIRSAMGIAALLRARTFFTWDRAANRLLDLYTRTRQAPTSPVRCHPLTLVTGSPTHGVLTPIGV